METDTSIEGDKPGVRTKCWIMGTDHNGFATHQRQIRAAVFGELVKLSTRITNFHSDLFHDAMWIETCVNRPRGFYWGVRESGTYIGDDLAHIDGGTLYRVTLLAEWRRWGQAWSVTTERIG